MSKKRTSALPLICLVCGDIARGMNFDVMTCMSCKIFFRRHAPIAQFQAPCQRRNSCIITKMTRRSCSYCRLNKCFSLGMNPLLIRNWSDKHLKLKRARSFNTTQIDQQRLPDPSPLNLLNNDSSSLTTDEWNLLSNIIHAYNEANVIPQIQSSLDEPSALVPKLRSKTSNSISIFKTILSTLQPFMECSPYYNNLSDSVRQRLIQNNTEIAGTTNTLLVIRELNGLENMTFIASCSTVYGYEVLAIAKRLMSRLEPNGSLVKVIILILAFSTNCSVLTYHNFNQHITLASTLSILNIQNMLVTMFWKYLNYQYGFQEAVRHFYRLITFTLSLIQTASEWRTVSHEKLMQSFTEETERSLTTD